MCSGLPANLRPGSGNDAPWATEPPRDLWADLTRCQGPRQNSMSPLPQGVRSTLLVLPSRRPRKASKEQEQPGPQVPSRTGVTERHTYYYPMKSKRVQWRGGTCGHLPMLNTHSANHPAPPARVSAYSLGNAKGLSRHAQISWLQHWEFFQRRKKFTC